MLERKGFPVPPAMLGRKVRKVNAGSRAKKAKWGHPALRGFPVYPGFLARKARMVPKV